MNITELQNRIAELEKENAYLKALLDNAGISYNTNPPYEQSSQEIYDENQDRRIIPVQITYNHVRAFFSYFWGRMDVFSKRYQNKSTGKAGYFTQCDNFWRHGICHKASGVKIKCKDCNNRSWTKLQAFHIEAHLIGKKDDASDVVGIYPSTSRTRTILPPPCTMITQSTARGSTGRARAQQLQKARQVSATYIIVTWAQT